MTYSEVVKTLKENGQINSSDVTGEQVLMLFHDGFIQRFTHNENVYEITFIPIEDEHEYMHIDTDRYSNYIDILCLLERWIHEFLANKPIYIIFNDEKFEIHVEVMETKR